LMDQTELVPHRILVTVNAVEQDRYLEETISLEMEPGICSGLVQDQKRHYEKYRQNLSELE